MLQPGTREVFARVEGANDAQVTVFEDHLRAMFADRGAADPATVLRGVAAGGQSARYVRTNR